MYVYDYIGKEQPPKVCIDGKHGILGSNINWGIFIFIFCGQMLKKMFSDISPNIDKNVHWYFSPPFSAVVCGQKQYQVPVPCGLGPDP